MTSHERVMAALTHKPPDRTPLNYYGTPETTLKLQNHLGLATHEELLCYFGADMRYVGTRYVGPAEFVGLSGYAEAGTDVWGIVWEAVANAYCAYNEIVYHPLAHVESVAEIEDHQWPDPDWFSVSHLKDEIAQLNLTERKAIVLVAGGPFEIAWYLRGMDRFFMDLIERPDIVEALMMRTTGFFKELAMRAVTAADGLIDIVWSTGDIGMQTGMLLSPESWRTQIKPWQRQIVEPFKQMGLKTRYHTDGSVAPVIEDLIEIGVDLLEPIQPKTKDMEAENLQARFGGRLAFYGGVDTQELMPMGTPEQIEAEVRRLIDTLGRNGGYIAAASNAVQPDVPIANILALYKTAREYNLV